MPLLHTFAWVYSFQFYLKDFEQIMSCDTSQHDKLEKLKPGNKHNMRLTISLILSRSGWFDKERNKNSGEINIAPASGEIITACNVGQANRVIPGHGGCI